MQTVWGMIVCSFDMIYGGRRCDLFEYIETPGEENILTAINGLIDLDAVYPTSEEGGKTIFELTQLGGQNHSP